MTYARLAFVLVATTVRWCLWRLLDRPLLWLYLNGRWRPLRHHARALAFWLARQPRPRQWDLLRT